MRVAFLASRSVEPVEQILQEFGHAREVSGNEIRLPKLAREILQRLALHPDRLQRGLDRCVRRGQRVVRLASALMVESLSKDAIDLLPSRPRDREKERADDLDVERGGADATNLAVIDVRVLVPLALLDTEMHYAIVENALFEPVADVRVRSLRDEVDHGGPECLRNLVEDEIPKGSRLGEPPSLRVPKSPLRHISIRV